MLKLLVDGNKIKDELGNKFVFRGICLNSPDILIDEGHDFLQDLKEIKKLGANAVQVPICPAGWQFYPDYCEKILDPIVKLAKELNLYCYLGDI